MIRVFLCDDHPLLREGLKTVLARFGDLRVVGEAGSGADTLAAVRAGRVDVVLLDVSLPDRNGIEVLKDLRAGDEPPAVIMLTMHPEDQYAVRALKAGAAGYLEKGCPVEDIVAAVRKAASGGRYVTPSLAELLAAGLGDGTEAPHERLSDREYQVLCRLASGRSLKEIAAELFLSPTTIATYRSRILDKLGVSSNAELVRYAFEHRLVE